MRRISSHLRAGCLIVAFALALAGGESFARGNSKKKGGGQSSASSASSSSGSRRHPAEVHLKGDDAPDSGSSPASASSAPPPSRGPTRIDFDDRLIQGQTNKAGAVYLYERKPLPIRPMVKKRESFRDEIVGSVYDG